MFDDHVPKALRTLLQSMYIVVPVSYMLIEFAYYQGLQYPDHCSNVFAGPGPFNLNLPVLIQAVHPYRRFDLVDVL